MSFVINKIVHIIHKLVAQKIFDSSTQILTTDTY